MSNRNAFRLSLLAFALAGLAGGVRFQRVQTCPQALHLAEQAVNGAGDRVGPDGVAQGVVVWDVEVTNQRDELVASYDILTLVAKRAA